MVVVAFVLFMIGIFKNDKRFYKAAALCLIFEVTLYLFAFGLLFIMNKLGINY